MLPRLRPLRWCAGLLVLLLVLSAAGFASRPGSPYVPLDSWTYPAMERLAALTGTRTAFLGMRPWTREQCMDFVRAVRVKTAKRNVSSEVLSLLDALVTEFKVDEEPEINMARVEMVYARTLDISGTPLRDSYHFGQTISNDFGRAFGEGYNGVDGASAYGSWYRFFVYVRGEFQRGESTDAIPPALVPVLKFRDDNTTQLLNAGGFGTVTQPNSLDSYVGLNFGKFTATFGKQSYYWGPTKSGPFLMSDNIDPLFSFRLTNTQPIHVPLLGRVRIDMMYGKLSGHITPADAYLHMEKISISPIDGLEFGFTRSVEFLGVGNPLTWRSFWKSYTSFNTYYGPPRNGPGHRRCGLDMSWKIPRAPMTFYTDSFCEDDPSPLAAPRRAAWAPGIYIAHLPAALHKFDLRLESAYTDLPGGSIAPGQNYTDEHYMDGYTNKGLIMGNTVGRAGKMWQAWSTLWLSPRNRVEFTFRQQKTSAAYIPGGGTQGSGGVNADLLVRPSLEVLAGFQAERWLIPALKPGVQNDFTGYLELRFFPRLAKQVNREP